MRISDWSSDVCSSDLISMMKGIEFRFNADFRGITKGDDGSLTVEMTGHDPITVDCVMFATGRVPNTGGLGLDKAGVEWDAKGANVVDEDSRSTCASIYAVGDVTNRVHTTPAPNRDGQAFAHTAVGHKHAAYGEAG